MEQSPLVALNPLPLANDDENDGGELCEDPPVAAAKGYRCCWWLLLVTGNSVVFVCWENGRWKSHGVNSELIVFSSGMESLEPM